MLYQYTDRKLGSIIGLTDDIRLQKANFEITNRVVQLFWNRGRDTVSFLVDDTCINLEPNQLVTITFFQHVQFPETASALTAFVFNREFYCMADYDKEVGCYGILFFGAQDIPVIIILEAKRMVYFTDKNVKEIAFELGFDDPAALSRLFKRITGETISNYKDKHPLQLE